MSPNAALPYETGHRTPTVTFRFPRKGTFGNFCRKASYHRTARCPRPAEADRLGSGNHGSAGLRQAGSPEPADKAGGLAAGSAIRFPDNNDGRFSATTAGKVDGA